QQCAPTWYDLSPIPKSALQTFCGSPGRPSGRNRAASPECSIHIQQPSEKLLARDQQRSDLLRANRFGVHLLEPSHPHQLCTPPPAPRAQPHTPPRGPSPRSSPTTPPPHAASPAERFQTPLASPGHAAIVITAPPQTQSDSLESQVP